MERVRTWKGDGMNRDLFAASGVGGGVVEEATTDPYFKSTTLLLSGDGTNGAQNNTFIDSSTNNAAITRSGTPTQGSFSPFSQTGWSGYFNGTSDYLTVPNSALLQVGAVNFTIECWTYLTTTLTTGAGQKCLIGKWNDGQLEYLIDYYSGNLRVVDSDQSVMQLACTLNAGTWYHIALVKSGSTSTLYINGVYATSSVLSFRAATSSLFIGYKGGASAAEWWPGYISNFRIVKGIAVYTGNFTPPTAPLTATQAAGTNIAAITGTATSLLTLQDNRFKDNALAPNTITVSGTPSIQAFSPFAPTAAYSLPAAAAGSAYFNGSTSSLNIGPTVPSTLVFGTSDFTVECWVNFASIPPGTTLMGNVNAGSTIFGIWSIYFYGSPSNKISFFCNAPAIIYDFAYTITPNQWVHLAICRANGNIRAFINGTQIGTTQASVVNITNTYEQVGGFYIGRSSDAIAYFPGYISNLRIVKGTAVYTGAFTPPGTPLSKIQSAGTNIAALSGTETSILTLQDSTFKDNSVNVATITASNPAPVIQSFTPFTQVWGGSFNGSSDYLSVTNSNLAFGTGAFTVEFWINPNSFSDYQYIIDTRGAGPDASGFAMYSPATGLLVVAIGNAGTISASTALTKNTWQHIAVSSTGTSVTLYLNGKSIGSGTYSTNIVDTTMRIATWYALNGSYYNGYISNFRVVKGVAVYTGAFTPPAKTLSATQAAGTNISAIYPGQTSLLTLQDPTFKDNATLPNTITATGTPKTQLLSAPFTSAATVDPVNGSGYFDGSSYLTTPSNAAFGFGTGDFTVEGWFYFTGTIGTYQRPWWFGDDNDNLEINSSVIRYGGASLTVITGSTALANIWYHIAYSRQSGSGKLFINGTQVGSTTASSYSSSTRTFTLMATSSGANPSTGYVSNFRIVKGTAVYTAAFQPPSAPLTAITNTSLLTLQDTTFKDNSTNAAVITASGTPVMRAFTPFASNWGGYFDGSSDYLSVPTNAVFNFGAGAYTVEMWIYPTIFPSVSAQLNMFQMGTHVVGSNFLEFGLYNNAGSVTLTYQLYNTSYKIVAQTQVLPSTNKWYHIAMIFTGSTAYTSLDGILSTGVAYSGSDAPTGQTVYIGAYNASTPYFTGYMSNLRVVKGTAVYTTNFTPPSAPLTAITGTSLLTLQNNTFIDNSSNALAITPSGAPKTQLLQLPFTSLITKVAAPWNISVTAPLATVGGSMYIDGSSGEGGSANNLTLPAILPTTLLGSSDFTIECWFYMTAAPSGRSYCLITNYYNSTNGYSIHVNSSRIITFNAAGDGNSITGTTVLPINSWHHMALCNTGGTSSKLYINGIQEGPTFTGTHRAGSLSQPFWIGQLYAGSYYSNFTGYIANFRVTKGTAVYTGNFTPPAAPPQPTQTAGLLSSNVNAIDGTNTSLLLLGSNAGIYDATAKNDIITVGDTKVSSTQIKYGTGAMYFDGTGDYLAIPASTMFGFGTGDFTIEMWVYFNSISSYQVLVGQFVSGTSYWAFNIGNGTSSGGIFTYNPGTGQVIVANEGSQAAWLANTWYHTTVVRSGTTVTIYRNGSSIATGNLSGSLYNPSSNISIGSAGVLASGYLNGYIDDLRVTKGIARYTANFTPPTKAMIGQ